MKVKITALKPLQYNVDRKVGEVFEAEEGHAKLLIAIGSAQLTPVASPKESVAPAVEPVVEPAVEPAVEPVVEKAVTYQTKVEVPESPTKRKTYKRRDLTAN